MINVSHENAIELQPVDALSTTGLRRIIAAGTTHTTLAFFSESVGIFFQDRRTGKQHLWTVEQIQAMIGVGRNDDGRQNF